MTGGHLRAALTALLSLAAPAAAAPAATLPPFAAAYEPVTVDERGMWNDADEIERALRDAPAVIRDPALNAYVRGVLCRAVGDERCRAVRLYIVQVAAFNASMMPNGAMQVWSGLLLRVRNEAELAAVLGHEFGHFELRHSLSRYKRARSTGDALAWLGLLGPQMAATSYTLVGLHFAYERADETQADLAGLRFLKASGYRATAASRVWQRIMAEQDQTALGRKRRVTQRYAAGFFSTHPSELARAGYLLTAAGPDGDGGLDNAEAFDRAMTPWRARFLADQIKLNDFGGSEYLLAQLAGTHWTPDLLFARAELYRERGHPRDLVNAADFYRQAIDGGCVDPAAWRGLGVALLRGGQGDAGRRALADYLRKAPDAADRAAMAMLVGQGDGI